MKLLTNKDNGEVFGFCLCFTTNFSNKKLVTKKKCMVKEDDSYLPLKDAVFHLKLLSLPKFFISKRIKKKKKWSSQFPYITVLILYLNWVYFMISTGQGSFLGVGRMKAIQKRNGTFLLLQKSHSFCSWDSRRNFRMWICAHYSLRSLQVFFLGLTSQAAFLPYSWSTSLLAKIWNAQE